MKYITKNELHKPPMIKIFIGTIITFIGKNDINCDKSQLKYINNYNLVKKVFKDELIEKYNLGIYKNNNKLYFIKTWHGNYKDLNYYSLINEATVSKVLFNRINNSKYTLGLKIPKLVEVIESNHSLSVIYEYINGDQLTEYPISKQATVMFEIMNDIALLSRSLTDSDKKEITQRTKHFYILTLPIITFFLVIKNSTSIKQIISLAIRQCKMLIKNKSKLVIAHRDFTPDNILLTTNSNHYLVDLERLVLTFPLYDIAYISIIPEYKELSKEIRNLKKLNLDLCDQLSSYIKLHMALSFLKYPSRSKEYLNANYI